MQIHVFDDHIIRGRPCDKNICPVALAILDAFEGAIDKITVMDIVWIEIGDAECVVTLPTVAIDFIGDFDSSSYEDAQPFSFDIEFATPLHASSVNEWLTRRREYLGSGKHEIYPEHY